MEEGGLGCGSELQLHLGVLPVCGALRGSSRQGRENLGWWVLAQHPCTCHSLLRATCCALVVGAEAVRGHSRVNLNPTESWRPESEEVAAHGLTQLHRP